MQNKPTSLLGFLILYLENFFVGIVKLHKCTDFRTLRET